MAAKKIAIGSGTFGDLYKTKTRKGTVVAVKSFRHDLICASTSAGRREIVRRFHCEYRPLIHPNIVQIIRVNVCESKPIGLSIVMELMTANLADLLERTRNAYETTARITREIAKGLSFLHTQSTPIVHRNLCPRNVLFKYEDGRLRVKIADGGLAQAFQASCGSGGVRVIPKDDRYMAPETRGYVCSRRITFHPTMDIYSLGIIIMEMINGTPPNTGAYPIDGKTDEEWEASLRAGIARLGMTPMADVVRYMVSMPQRRPTADRIVDIMQDKQLIAEMSCLDFQQDIAELESAFQRWIPVRKQTIRGLDALQLNAMTDRLNALHRQTNAVTAGTTAVTAVGGLLIVGAAVASLFGAGTAVQTVAQVGRLTKEVGKAGTKIARAHEHRVTNADVRKVDDVIERDSLQCAQLCEAINAFTVRILEFVVRFYTDPDAMDLNDYFCQLTADPNFFKDGAHAPAAADRGVYIAGAAAFPTATLTGTDLGKELAAFVVSGLSAVGNVYHDVGTAATILSLPLDILNMAQALKRLQTKANCPAADWVERVRAQTRCDMEEGEVRSLVLAYLRSIVEKAGSEMQKQADAFFKSL